MTQGVDKLTKLAVKYKTNMLPELGYSYTDLYNHLFSGKVTSVKKVLQIGLGEKENNSLYMWRDFFTKAKIYGIGSDKKYALKRSNIQTYVCDRTDSQGLKNIINKIGTNIDVVIDEGKRNPNEILASFQTIMPLLKKDSMYVIENTDGKQAAVIINNLKNYNYNVIRHHRMISRFDRLIAITNRA